MPASASSAQKSKRINPDSPVPLFFQVSEDLANALRNGDYKVGERFTTVREVAADYGVSFVTAQKALARLAQQQLIRSERGKGTTALVGATKRKSRRAGNKVHRKATATRRVTVLWPTHLPVATALRSNLLATVDGLRAALPNCSVALEFAGELLLEDRATNYLGSMLSGGPSAFVLVSAPAFIKQYFEHQRVPTVVLGDVESGIALSCVSSDEEKAQYDLTKHLIKKGHRRIVQVISAPRVAGHEPRLRGFRRALADAKESGIVIREDWELMLPHEHEEAMARFKAVLNDPLPPTAAICTGLTLASWVKDAAGERFHVAYDLDRDPLHIPPIPSTSLIWPGERMGRLAGELLKRQINGDFSLYQEVLGYSQIRDNA